MVKPGASGSMSCFRFCTARPAKTARFKACWRWPRFRSSAAALWRRPAGLPICRHSWLLRSDWESNQAKVARSVAREIGFPCFVKPANLGSSVGVSKATDKASLAQAIDLAARYDRKIMVEELVAGREIECAVMGN